MPTVVGVKLRYAGKVLFFDPAGQEVVPGDVVIVSTARGQEMGEVAEAAHEVEASQIVEPLMPVLRVATPSDLESDEQAREKEVRARKVFRELVEKHGLDMKPINAELLFDGSKMVFYFTAEERVDFRELVKDLAAEFKVRVEMRQVGVRDEARMVGGLGHCGEQLCCARLGGEFQPVSIRMAKEQDLPLNPLKISGLCGRLMCCLRYEYEAYKDFKQRAPKKGSMVCVPGGQAKVVELDTPKELVGIYVEGDGVHRVPLAEMTCSKGGTCPCSVPAESLKPKETPLGPLDSVGETPVARTEAKPAEKPEAKPEGKRRRRRGGGERASSEAKQRPEAKPKQQTAPQPQGEAASAEKSGSGRRRRRRRRPGSGGGSSEAAG